ncbi:MAG: HAMP domain-containing sensor histidine kinase [Lachnospiraceae bacterium]|nr:HAMP domain-containing sensor histidine kinase [Lachnospiraceae bacterium]
MKNEYRRFRKKILLRAFAVFILASAVWYGVFSLAAQSVLGTLVTEAAVQLLVYVRGMTYKEAEELFKSMVVNNKQCIGLLGCIVSVGTLFVIAVSRMTAYLSDISSALDQVEHAPEAPVVLPEELLSLTGQLEELKGELLRREKEAAVSEQKKNELVAYLAHDLRTPLTSVVAYLTMLENQPDMDPSERAKYTHITLEKALRLEELINEFFDITKFNLQDFVLEKQEMDLSIFLEQIADENYGMLQKKGMTCAVDAQEGLMIEGDPDKLARVFENLLRNAAAYGSENTQILIQARGGHGRTTIVFTNEGPQIPQKKLEMIFERFYRADDSRSSKTGGSGLGLAIAKQVVELHGGTITAASDQKNTRFIVTFPPVGQEKRILR